MLGIGSVVDGKYRLLSEIGHGGMSVVYLAINERANKTWAIKEVRKDGGNDSEVVQQGLIAETEMLKKLNHPHLPSIVDVIDKEDSFLIVMDYIEGKSLQSVLNHNGPQDPEDVIEWAKQLCDTLGYLHSRRPSIIYRDMKPANVMLKPDGSVTLIDFGTAREYKAHSEGDTTWLGTRGYAAPEQFGGRGQTDGRTDIYCLGATMYHLLTGKSPADTNFVIYPLGQLNPIYAGTGLEKVVAKCCEPDAANRYQSCAELMYALEHIHDEDDTVLRKRNAQWGSFIACIIIALISAAGMITFKVLESNATNRSYDYYVQQAKGADTSGGMDAAKEEYRKAMGLRPSSPDAYTEILNAIESDGKFTVEENTALQSCILDTNGSTRKNIDYFEAGEPEKYADFVYRLANDYYFFYEGSDSKVKAANWYEKILDSSHLSSQQINLANGLYNIGNYYSMLGSEKSMYMVGDSSYDYHDFWDDMVEMTDGDVVAKTGGAHYAAGLYKEFAFQIYSITPKFKEYGIDKAAMVQQLDKMENAVNGISTSNNTVMNLVEQTKTQISSARQMVETIYSGVGGAIN